MSTEEQKRRDLVERIGFAGRVLSTAAVMYHSAVAAKVGLGATEEKAMDLLERFGPLSAGELSARSGLAPASVTGLIGRLESKGFARRIPNPADGRSVLVELVPENLAALVGLFDDFVTSLNELLDGYSVEQLETVLHFCTEAARRQEAATSRLAGKEPG